MKFANLKNENRVMVEELLKIQAEKKALEKREKELKKALEKVFAENSNDVRTNGKTNFFLVQIQRAGKKIPVVFKKTFAQGSIDYKALCNYLEVAPEILERFRRDETVKTTVEEVSEKQLAKYSEMSNT